MRIREVNLATRIITTIAGNGTSAYSGDGGPAIAAEFNGPTGVAVDGTGHVFVVDGNDSPLLIEGQLSNSRIREIIPERTGPRRQPCPIDDPSRRPEQGLWRSTTNAYGELQRSRQRRYPLKFHYAANIIYNSRSIQSCRFL